MKKPILNTVVRLTNQEYIDTWSSLVQTFYQEGISDDQIYQNLGMSAEGEQRFPVEFSTILTVIAILTFDAKPKLCLYENQRDKLKDGIIEAVYKKIVPDAGAETIASCSDYCRSRIAVFRQICRGIYSTNPQKRQADLVGFARYLAAQVSSRDESENTEAIQRLGIILSSASDAYMRLLSNSTQDTTQLNGKPSFSVKKEG